MKRQSGFSIVMAIFILVVLALLSSYMVKMAGAQLSAATFSMQGARAYQSARAGLGWAIARVSAGGGCTEITDASPLSFTGINDFSVTLSCTSQSFSEADATPVVYKITALSEFDTYSSANYISRSIVVSFVD